MLLNVYTIIHASHVFQINACSRKVLILLTTYHALEVLYAHFSTFSKKNDIIYIHTSRTNDDALVSMSSSEPILENISPATLMLAYSAGTKDPIWAIICNRGICFK